MFSFLELFSYSVLAIRATASQHAQTPLRSPLHEVRYVECGSALWSGRIYDCGQIDVPLDWNNPGIGSITLNFTILPVRRRIQRKGSIFYHSGHEYLGRPFDPETTLNLMIDKQLDTILLGYDVVTWTPRESAIADRARCFEIGDWRYWSQNPFGTHENATIAFYNTTFRDVLHREPPWNEHMSWSHTQGPEDVKDMLRVQEKLIAHCLNASPDRDLFKYVGTAASARDMAALADALDGPGSSLNLWTRHHGSVLASHLLQMFPERIGKVVMDDPVDPISYQESEAYKRWAADIATVNSTVHHIQLHEMRNGSTGYMQFYGHPIADQVRMDSIIQFLHGELVEWHTRAEADHHLTTQEKEWGSWRRELDSVWLSDPRQSHARGPNSGRSTAYRGRLTRSLLDGMPLVCGDALYDHDPDITMRAEVEAFLVDSMHAAPLIVSSAFPPLRYLCHLWPIRAAERMPLGDTYRSSNEDTQVLILLRDQDYWNYFAVSEELARERWPAASVVGGLHYGDVAWNHDQCSADIVKALFKNGSLPNGSRPCQYDTEA
ncbi:hypothetical protein K466DRAFT_656297 [Polyporus arcularius HHB13444]|uniref:Uncharacterized protein n=1 Tax=Polyporus arcularius HHB13444 TaxID=1314778 RepID=A0A5C3NWK3_9APHY|nr:hypothetical protein K466DRAFT_656297 [Polyporus arcularius HHB13444]